MSLESRTPNMAAPTLRWWYWLALGQWRAAPGRAAVSILAVAIGVALALAIHLVNASALEEFRQAIATVNGESHAQIRAKDGAFDEALWARLVRSTPTGVAAMSPVIETELMLDRTSSANLDAADRPRSVRLIAIDPFAAAAVTPALMPMPQSAQAQGGQTSSEPSGADSPLFSADAVFLSPAALEALGARVGDRLRVLVGLQPVDLRIAGTVPGAAPGQQLAVMDLGTAQWRLNWLGRLSRIDLRLTEGADPRTVQETVSGMLPADAAWSTPQASEQRMSNVSRAYRVNLNVLALVALFTGAFLVFTTMALSVARQQGELALMGVMGASRKARLGAVLAQGVLLGMVGAIAGLALGVMLAAGVLSAVGGDLGGGYFSGSRPRLVLDPFTLTGFAALGVAVGVLGSIAPAWSSSRLPAAQALRSGSAEDMLAGLARGRWVLALALAGAALLFAPPIAGLPIAAYLAIALWLVAGIACVPLLTRTLGRLLARLADAWLWRSPSAWLACTRLAQSPGTVAAGLAGVVASFALASAMAIMVSSFRTSVAQWLDAVLPADVYARAPSGGQAPLDPAMQAAIAAAPGVIRAEFLRTVELSLDPERPALAVVVRPIDSAHPERQLPLTGPSLKPPDGAIAVWVSEPILDLYRTAPGSTLELPIGASGDRAQVFVAGVWRDYARQHGALAIDAGDWSRLTGQTGASDVALWLDANTTPESVIASVSRDTPELSALEWRSARDIRALSLRIFDRSFAVTYALEAIAIGVGLFGVAAACAGDALARAREFGMLRHVGVRTGQIARQLSIEAALGVSIAVVWGGLIGAAIGLVLIERVNPQSFHWTMQVHWPLGLLVGSAGALILAAIAAALVSARSALGTAPLMAVRQDW